MAFIKKQGEWVGILRQIMVNLSAIAASLMAILMISFTIIWMYGWWK